MLRVSGLMIVLSAVFAPAAFAQTPEHLAAVERAAATGWDIYEHDQAAWRGTDAMLAEIRDPRGEGLRGWITERTTEGIQVLFLRSNGESTVAVYRALYRDGALLERGRINQPLTAAQERINRALSIAIAAPLPQQCAERYNSVILPRATPGPDGADIDVYLMPAMSVTNEAPFGGHFRFAVDTSAGVVRETQRFTNSCITLSFESNTAGLMISQTIGETPTEIHVFESLTTRLRVNVVSQSGHWSIDGRNVTYVEPYPAR